jgi:hypothetical protein
VKREYSEILNFNGGDFLLADLDLALTLMDVAETTRNKERVA